MPAMSTGSKSNGKAQTILGMVKTLLEIKNELICKLTGEPVSQKAT
jgi:hypothetical protein